MRQEEIVAWGLGGLFAAIALRLSEMRRRAAALYRMPRPKFQGVAFAAGHPAPRWPIQKSRNKRWREVAYVDVNGKTHGNGSRRFKAKRAGGARWHVGIDLYADENDVVVAPEDGVLVEEQNFLSTIPGEDAILMQGDSGVVFLFGEVYANSNEELGVDVGDRVRKGQPIARVAKTTNGSHMLHFETYRAGTLKNRSWRVGQRQPDELLDPTDYLLRARTSVV